MTNRVGSSTIYGTILPNNNRLSRIKPTKLSREAKHRLKVIEYYLSHNKNISLTSRHYGVSRSYVYNWLSRFRPYDLSTLENKSTRPHKVRSAQYDYSTVKTVRKIRQDYPTYSSKKIAVLLLRDYAVRLSHSTIGRIILRYSLYFAIKYKQAKQRSKRARYCQYLVCNSLRWVVRI